MVRESIGDDYCILSSKNGSLEWSTERVLQQLPFDKATNRVGAWNKTMVGKRGRKWSGGDFDIQTIQVWYVSCVTWYMAALSHLISCPLCSERFTYLVCICRWHLIFVITAPVRLSMIFTRKIRAGRFQLNTESCLIDSLPLTMVLVAQFLQHISVMVVKTWLLVLNLSWNPYQLITKKNTFSPLLRSFEPLDDRAFHLFLELSCDLRIIHIIHSPCYTTSCLSFVDVVWKPFLVCRRWSWTSSGLVPRNVDVRREETLCLKPRMHETPQIMGRKHGNMFFLLKRSFNSSTIFWDVEVWD